MEDRSSDDPLTGDQLEHWNRLLDTPLTRNEARANILKATRELIIYKNVLGNGSYGTIHAGKVLTEGGLIDIAVKLQNRSLYTNRYDKELKFYEMARETGNLVIPKIYYSGIDKKHFILGLQLLGNSLAVLFRQCHKKFSLKTVLLIGDQVINCLEAIHDLGYIHMDLKPSNIVIGGLDPETIYIIDYGQIEKYTDENGDHRPAKFIGVVCGPVRYTSVSSNNGFQQSRKDDVLGMFNILLYFLHGRLPWQNLKSENRDELILKVRKEKQKQIGDLVSNSPEEFQQLFESLNKLGFAEKPHYEEYRNILRTLAAKKGYLYDYNFDWTGTQQN